MATVTPIVSTDPPTARLMRAFERSGWLVSHIFMAYAILRSPDRQHRMLIRVDRHRPDRVVAVRLDGQPVDIDAAIDFVRGN